MRPRCARGPPTRPGPAGTPGHLPRPPAPGTPPGPTHQRTSSHRRSPAALPEAMSPLGARRRTARRGGERSPGALPVRVPAAGSAEAAPRLGWAVRSGAVRSGAVRCGAERPGPARSPWRRSPHPAPGPVPRRRPRYVKQPQGRSPPAAPGTTRDRQRGGAPLRGPQGTGASRTRRSASPHRALQSPGVPAVPPSGAVTGGPWCLGNGLELLLDVISRRFKSR